MCPNKQPLVFHEFIQFFKLYFNLNTMFLEKVITMLMSKVTMIGE